jgi:hypothetical protein
VMRDTFAASSLPALVDADHACGDAKNVTRVVQGYEAMWFLVIVVRQRSSSFRLCERVPPLRPWFFIPDFGG